MRVFHYTVAARLLPIVRAGELRLSTRYRDASGEAPGVWCTQRPDWEPCLNGYAALDTGRIMGWLDRWETAVWGRGLARIEVDPSAAPLTYAEFLRVTDCAPAYRAAMEATNPTRPTRLLWRIGLTPIPRDRWRAVELFDARAGAHRWRDWKDFAPGATDADLEEFVGLIGEEQPVPLNLRRTAPMRYKVLGLPCPAAPPLAARTPAAVARHFDDRAEIYDWQMGAALDRVEILIAATLTRLGLTDYGTLDVLDLGCGTGRLARRLKPYARQLVGVDVSRGMLDRAAACGGYDELHHAEVVAQLRHRVAPASCDLIVAADLLPYGVDLDELLRLAAVALRPHGAILATVDLTPSDGRATHGADDVQRACAAAGLTAGWVQAPLRAVPGGWVEGIVFRAVHSASAADPLTIARWGEGTAIDLDPTVFLP